MIPLLQNLLVALLLIVQLNSFRGIDFSCTFSVGLKSLIHKDSAIFRFFLLLLRFMSMIFKLAVLAVLGLVLANIFMVELERNIIPSLSNDISL